MCAKVYRRLPHYYPFLGVFKLDSYSFEFVDWELFEPLTRLNLLEWLKVYFGFSRSAEMNLMCKCLQACQIKHLVLKNTSGNDTPTLPLIISHKLESLKLKSFHLTWTWAQSVGNKSFSLHTLRLKHCTIPDATSTALIHSLQSPHCVLHTLKLSNAGLFDKDAIEEQWVPNTLLEAIVYKLQLLETMRFET